MHHTQYSQITLYSSIYVISLWRIISCNVMHMLIVICFQNHNDCLRHLALGLASGCLIYTCFSLLESTLPPGVAPSTRSTSTPSTTTTRTRTPPTSRTQRSRLPGRDFIPSWLGNIPFLRPSKQRLSIEERYFHLFIFV